MNPVANTRARVAYHTHRVTRKALGKAAAFAVATALPLTVPVIAQAQTNLVVNGDFSAGNTGFGTDYTYTGGNVSNPPDYSVVANPKTSFPGINFLSYGDHTTGTGLMLYGDGAPLATDRVWYETLNLAANTTYSVSFWGADCNLDHSGTNADLQFFAGGTQVGSNLNLPFTDSVAWSQFTGTFFSGTGGNVVVSINDANTDVTCNDFTIDDISVRAVSSAAAPEPGSLILLGGSLLTALSAVKLRKARGKHTDTDLRA